MKKDNERNDLTASKQTLDLVLGVTKDSKIYSHAVFCQCVLPVRALPKEEDFYQVKHGNTSLIIQAGVLTSEAGIAHKMEVPAGAKARLLFPYIIDQAKRTGNPVIDMGESLRDYMNRNNIPIGGSNAKEISRQVRNIGASNISLGMWGETETQKFSSQKNYRVASEISFWTEKHPDQLSIWNPYITVSDEFMAAIESHCVLLDLQPLIALQANPRAMDIFTWLSYRIQTVRYPVKISYADLHSIFGKQTKELKNFKAELKRSIKQALPYIPGADVDVDSDKKHLILKNTSRLIFLPSGKAAQIGAGEAPVGGDVFGELQASNIFGELESLGLAAPVIAKLTKDYDIGAIQKAAFVTKQNMESGKVKNPAGLFTKALKEKWEPVVTNNEDTGKTVELEPVDDSHITDPAWKAVRASLLEQLGQGVFNSWIAPLDVVATTKTSISLEVPTRFIEDYVEQHYLKHILAAFKVQNKAIQTIKLCIKETV